VSIDRKTPMLLPPSLQDWIPQRDMVHFIVDWLETLDVSAAAVNERGCGSQQYPPAMMLGLLIYCYAQGIFSSRKIEQATYQNVSVRYLTANHHPDHDTIAEFRRRNSDLIAQAFVELLRLGKELGLLQLGNIAIDGTKIAAATTKKRNRTYQQLQEEVALLHEQVQGLMAQAEQADQQEIQPELPEELSEKQKRLEQLRQAKARLEQQTRQAHEDREKQRRSFGQNLGNKPKALPKEPGPKARINLTDPQSTLTRTRHGFIQGYNVQMAIATQGGIIVATDVVTDACDRHQLEPMTARCIQNGCKPKRVLVDKGYENVRQGLGIYKKHKIKTLWPPVAIANDQGDRSKGRPNDRRSKQWRWRMKQKIQTARGKALYLLRTCTAEPAIGIIKSAMGFRRFLLRGLTKVKLEWALVALAFNCKRMAARLS
jgi:transposase